MEMDDWNELHDKLYKSIDWDYVSLFRKGTLTEMEMRQVCFTIYEAGWNSGDYQAIANTIGCFLFVANNT